MADDTVSDHDPVRTAYRSTRDPTGDPTRCGHHGGLRKDGKPCVGLVVRGTVRCRKHGGLPVAQQKARGAIVTDLRKWGLGDTTANPHELYLRLISQCADRCERYAGLLAEAYEAAETLQAAHAAEDIVLVDPEPRTGFTPTGDAIELAERPDRQVARLALQRIFGVGGVAALIGHQYDATKDGDLYATQEAIRALVKLEQDERRFLADMCAKAMAAGLAKRRVDLAAKVVDEGQAVTYVLVNVDDEALR